MKTVEEVIKRKTVHDIATYQQYRNIEELRKSAEAPVAVGFIQKNMH